MRLIGLIQRGNRPKERNETDRSHLRYLDAMKRTNSPSELGAAIRERRRVLGMTQDDLALSIGVNRKVIGQLEGGKETVRLEIALNAARSLGLNVGVEARGETDS
jgi:HTH-type transcriptional regulator / antitoxin HipB